MDKEIETYNLENSKVQRTSDLEFWKGMVRPYLIVFSWTLLGIMWLCEVDVPLQLQAVATAIVVEYFGERAAKRFKEKK